MRDGTGGARGTKLNGDGIALSFSCTSSGGADGYGLGQLSLSSISNPGLLMSHIWFLQSIGSDLINVIQQPPRSY